ncbi:MAG: AMP-binding protein [Immundisolibacterales bacterium]|nr:AMP-binding protein [Immundisolibacterales bacterium]
MSRFAWRPTPEQMESCNLVPFMRHAGVEGHDYDALLAWCKEDPERFWNAAIAHLDLRFPVPYARVRDTSGGLAWTKWCIGGRTNVVVNCIERHRGTPVEDRPAIRWEGERGDVREWTYREFDRQICRLAGGLRSLGLGPGDAIGLYMPMIPEVTAAFFAVQHIGAVVVPLFSGFGPDAIRDRLQDAGAKAVLTVDATWRRGVTVPMKATLDAAADRVASLRHVVVYEHLGEPVRWNEARDRRWSDLTDGQADRIDCELMDAEAVSMLIYTSGSTGRPKGTVHTHCSYVVKMAVDFLLCMDFRQIDRMLWMSDFGWVVGPMQLAIATLGGGCLVIAEGVPDYPEPGRMWRLVQDHRVSYLGVAPTAIRSLMRHGDGAVAPYDLSSLRCASSTGEPWTEEAWNWLFHTVGGGRMPILNITGGTELAGAILVSIPLRPLKPCSFNAETLGVSADIVDEAGRTVAVGEVGELVLREANIGMTRGVWRDPERYLETYWNRYAGRLWRQGDWARRDEDGQWFVEGRSDDTLKIAGKRTGPAEIEGLALATGSVSEAAAVGVPDPVSGQALLLAMVPAAGVEPGPELERAIADAVGAGLGRPFRPKRQLFVSDLPKTRNTKILRRVVKAVVTGGEPGDLTALLNPEAIEELKRVAGTA